MAGPRIKCFQGNKQGSTSTAAVAARFSSPSELRQKKYFLGNVPVLKGFCFTLSSAAEAKPGAKAHTAPPLTVFKLP